MPKQLKISAMELSNRASSREESGFRPASDTDEFIISMPPFLGLTGPFAFRDRNMLDGSARKREGPKVPPDPQSMPTQEQCFAKL